MHYDLISHGPEPCQISAIGKDKTVRTTNDRAETRYAIERLIWLVRTGGARKCATMINVSRGGFCLKVSQALSPGERVLLNSGAGDIPAEIRWSTHERAGGVFILPDY